MTSENVELGGVECATGFVEFRGAKGLRFAVGRGASWMVSEVREDFPTTVSTGEKMTTGSTVYFVGLPTIYVQDFFPNVVEKMCRLGGYADRMSEVLDSYMEKAKSLGGELEGK